jgi:hypothetical protein
MIPLYEAKLLHLFDTRWATYEPDGTTRLMSEEEKAAHASPLPRYWADEAEIERKVDGRWAEGWFMGWRRIARATDERTLIVTKLPRVALGDSVFVALTAARGDSVALLQGYLGSYALDYVMRQKMGGTNASFYLVGQLPVPAPPHSTPAAVSLPLGGSYQAWVARRVDRLNGWIIDPDDRARTGAELDALMFHVYGLARHEVSHVMDTFPIVMRKDVTTYGYYRTKEFILDVYDALSEAQTSGTLYRAPWTQEVAP